jgi:bacterioferritin
MKGNEKIIKMLNDMLSDELTAVNQYMVHAQMCANWGYKKLEDTIEHRAIEEMKHAEKLIDRILFFEGIPVVSVLQKMSIGSDVHVQLKNDHASEEVAINGYNASIKLCTELVDNGTREILEDILEDEEVHIDWIEAQLDQIEQMGIQNYLVEQI